VLVTGHVQIYGWAFEASIGDIAAVEEAEKMEQSDLREERKIKLAC